MLVFIPVIAAFVITGGAVYAYGEMLLRRNRGVRDRMDRITGSFTVAPSLQSGLQAPGPRPDLLPTVTGWLSGSDLGHRLKTEMLRGGLRLRPAEFVALCVMSTVGLALVGVLLTDRVWMALVMGVIGLCIPIALLQQRQGARRRKFDSQLTDALTLIASSLRSGYSFMRAVQTVAEEMPAPISEEFHLALGEATLGVPMETALTRMVERVRSYDLDLATTAVNIQLQVGGNLAEILDTISETIRERVRVQGEINGLTAEGKLSGIILFLLPVVLAMVLTLRNPDYFKPLLDDPHGVPMLAGAAIAQIIGGVIIRKMVALDV